MTNLEIAKADLDLIRSLPDLDLIMVLSEIHDHGWSTASKLLPTIRQAFAKGLIKPVTARLN